eukprot:1687173-Amphidinium_carterae.1
MHHLGGDIWDTNTWLGCVLGGRWSVDTTWFAFIGVSCWLAVAQDSYRWQVISSDRSICQSRAAAMSKRCSDLFDDAPSPLPSLPSSSSVAASSQGLPNEPHKKVPKLMTPQTTTCNWAERIASVMDRSSLGSQIKQFRIQTACSGTGAASLCLKALAMRLINKSLASVELSLFIHHSDLERCCWRASEMACVFPEP